MGNGYGARRVRCMSTHTHTTTTRKLKMTLQKKKMWQIWLLIGSPGNFTINLLNKGSNTFVHELGSVPDSNLTVKHYWFVKKKKK